MSELILFTFPTAFRPLAVWALLVEITATIEPTGMSAHHRPVKRSSTRGRATARGAATTPA